MQPLKLKMTLKRGWRRASRRPEKKAEKMKDKAKKSKDGKDAEAKESAKDAKKLRKTVLKSIQEIDSANDRNIREEIGLHLIEDKWGAGDWIRKPVEKWECKDSKAWRKLFYQGERHKSDPESSGVRQNLDHENAGFGYECARQPRTDQMPGVNIAFIMKNNEPKMDGLFDSKRLLYWICYRSRAENLLRATCTELAWRTCSEEQVALNKLLARFLLRKFSSKFSQQVALSKFL